MASMEAHFGKPIKQYAGQQQVDRAVVVSVPGKHFPFLSAAQQKLSYDGTAVEYRERYAFEKHAKAWGGAHSGPGIRFILRERRRVIGCFLLAGVDV